jgi:spermidine/putrescine transport system substrate-binding protein
VFGKRHLRRRQLSGTRLVLLGSVAGVLVLAACSAGGGNGSSGTGATKGKPFAGDTLVVLNWQDYGSDLPWAVSQFEKMTGAKVVNQYKTSDPEEITLLQNGGVGTVDVAIVNHAYVQTAIADDLLQPIDTSKVTTYSQIYPQLRQLPELTNGGKIYGVPWEWGTTALTYNPQLVSQPINSWAALWSSQYAGKVAFFDDPQTAVETAALYLNENPASPNLTAVKSALVKLKDNSKVLWTSTNDWTRAFSSGGAVVGDAWSSLPSQLSKPKMTYVVPQDGAVGWLDSWTIVKNAPHLDLAYAWINFMTSVGFMTKFSADPSHEAAGTSNMVAAKELSPATVAELNADPSSLSRVHFVAISPAALSTWTQLWEQVKAG